MPTGRVPVIVSQQRVCLAIDEPVNAGVSDQIGPRLLAHPLLDVRAVRFDGAFADAEPDGDV